MALLCAGIHVRLPDLFPAFCTSCINPPGHRQCVVRIHSLSIRSLLHTPDNNTSPRSLLHLHLLLPFRACHSFPGSNHPRLPVLDRRVATSKNNIIIIFDGSCSSLNHSSPRHHHVVWSLPHPVPRTRAVPHHRISSPSPRDTSARQRQ